MYTQKELNNAVIEGLESGSLLVVKKVREMLASDAGVAGVIELLDGIEEYHNSGTCRNNINKRYEEKFGEL